MSHIEKASPSKGWYVAHLFLWFISGAVCYIIWKDKNPEAAKKHLIHSLWLGLLIVIIIYAISAAIFSAAFMSF